MVTLVEQLANLLKIFSTPTMTIFIVIVVGIAGFGFFLWLQLKPEKKILYFSEDENLGEEMSVKRMAPAHLYSKKKKDLYRFIRFREAYNFTIGLKNVTRWLAKKGTAFTQNLETGDVGPFTLYQIMEVVWSKETIEALKDEQKQKLIKSEIPITVRLESMKEPEGYEPMTEIYITEEEDAEMARLFGENVRKELHREDWIRTIALVGCGIALAYVAQAMGLLAGVAT